MKQFTFSDMNRASGEILEAALVEPVSLTKRGKDKLVILTAEQIPKAYRSFAHADLRIARRTGRHSSGIDDRLGRYHRDRQCLSLGRSSGSSICGAARRQLKKSRVAGKAHLCRRSHRHGAGCCVSLSYHVAIARN